MRERVLVIRAEGEQARGIRALEPRYPDLEFVYCESFLSGIVEASRGGVRAMLARVDDGPRRLMEAVGALREAGGRETKIVLCCAPEHEPQAQEALSGGADDYVIEPVLAADVDRAIGYGRVGDLPLAGSPPRRIFDLARRGDRQPSAVGSFAAEPAASMEELAGLSELLGLMDGPPREILKKAADLVRTAMGASGATIVVEGTAAQSGEPGRVVLTAVLHDGERVIGQVSVGERNVEKSKSRKVERSDEVTEGRCDGGSEQRLGAPHSTAHRAVAHGTLGLSGYRSPIASGGTAYTLGDAEKLEQYAHVLAKVIAAAGRQRELRRLAVVDEASGLPNRRYLREQLGAILRRAADERFAVTVLLFDVDDFKSYNDRFGHDAGDEILRVTGELFRKNCREQDVVARYGGDEFAVVFYDPHGPREAGSKPPAEALFVLDRFKDELARVNVKTSKRPNIKTAGVGGRGSGVGEEPGSTSQSVGQPMSQVDEREGPSMITISGGLATYPWDGNTVDGLLRAADEALLAAKRAGKNRIFVVGQ